MWDLVHVETEILARGPINKPITIIGICDYTNNSNTPGYTQHAYISVERNRNESYIALTIHFKALKKWE